MQDPCFGAYSSITDLMFGFDETILQAAFGVCLYLCLYKVYLRGNLGSKKQIVHILLPKLL